MPENPVMVTHCAVGLARVSAMSIEGVTSSDAVSIEVDTIADEHLVLLLPTGMASYLANSFEKLYREVLRSRSSVAHSILRGLYLAAMAVLLTTFFVLCYTSGFAVAMVVPRTWALALGVMQILRLVLHWSAALVAWALRRKRL